MIQARRWRRSTAVALDPSTGNVNASVNRLLKTDHTSVVVLHLEAGGSSDRHARSFGQLVVCVGGEGTVEVGSERVALRAGESVRWPPDVAHQLSTDTGVSVIVVTYPEDHRSWRVSLIDDELGERWTMGVFGDTDEAKAFRDSAAASVRPGERVVLE